MSASVRPAVRAWTLMQHLVDAEDRHAEMARALGFGLGGGRGRALSHLRSGPCSLVELAAAVGVDAPYATVVVDQLEAHGLVERRPHPDDRRRRLVALTPAGDGALATVDAIAGRPPAAMGALRAGELRQLVDLLVRLVDAGPAG